MLFFRRCFFRLEWGDGGGSSLGLELSDSAGPLAGEGRGGQVWEEGGELGTEYEEGQGLPRPPSPKASCPGRVGNLAEQGKGRGRREPLQPEGRKAQGLTGS